MDEQTTEVIAQLVEASLQTTKGQEWLREAHANLISDAAKGRFNLARSHEVYAIVIERALMAHVPGSTGITTLKTGRESGITSAMAGELVDQFRGATGISQNQRPARGGLMAKILGK